MLPIIDLRSDTATQPPPGMRHAIATAVLGDDVYGEDPTVNRLEKLACGLLGKDASIFVPSGTMANLLAILAHCRDRKRLLVGNQSDIWRWEAGGASILGGLVYEPIPTQPGGQLAIKDLEDALYGQEDFQCVPAGLICIENTHCLSGGSILPLDYLGDLRDFAREQRLPVHLDGARLFNAAVRLGVEARRIADFADSVSICLSKGLAAPVGSLVAGPAPFIGRVRRIRKMLGGGMRKAGVLAAAGIYALEHMRDRLTEDHANAALMAERLTGIPEISLETKHPETNIVFWRLSDPKLNSQRFILELERHGIRVMELGKGKIRAVTHYGITTEDIHLAVEAILLALAECEVSDSPKLTTSSRFPSFSTETCPSLPQRVQNTARSVRQ